MSIVLWTLFFSVSKYDFGKYLSLEEKCKNRSKIRKGEGYLKFILGWPLSQMPVSKNGLCLSPNAVWMNKTVWLWRHIPMNYHKKHSWMELVTSSNRTKNNITSVF